MGRTVVTACLPWTLVLVALVACLWFLVRLNRGRIEWRRFGLLNRDEVGSAQSLSFVLTLPLFVAIMLLIVQVSQVMIGTMVVHYAAFAAARSALVWIPARVGLEPENQISLHYLDPMAVDQVYPSDVEPTAGGLTYVVAPAGAKYETIRRAAVMGCASIGPSRDLGLVPSDGTRVVTETMTRAYESMAPDSAAIGAVPRRMRNKMAYADRATVVELRVFHRNSDAPLWKTYMPYAPVPPIFYEHNSAETPYFLENEIDWQDDLTVTVHYEMALLPGPGQLWAAFLRQWDDEEDTLSRQIEQELGIHTYRLTATVTLGNEGEKSVIPYVY
ncbi:MAG: hypothetical protein JW888_12170 [Pirellulales bacterium]|nr:hypothetical protein [Pirellulales bacterium]